LSRGENQYVLQDRGELSDAEMVRVFNLGLGLIFVTASDLDARVDCPAATEIGRVVPVRAERVIIRGLPTT